MTKYDPYNDLPHPDRTVVHSKTYGEHIRARRGSKKRVEVNDTLKLHNLFLTSANNPARLVKNEIDYYRAGFPSGQLWQFLVGMFKKQIKLKLPLNVDDLLWKDISKDYSVSRLLKHGFPKQFTSEESTIKVEIGKLNPQFRRQTIDGYQIEIAVIYFDFVNMESTSDSSASPIVPLNHSGILSFELDSGKRGDRFIICFKITGCCQGILQSDNSIMAMQIIQTGIV
ncbi:hypothetical protein [Daejeonella sp.]|uniref:hypothetical protein n=1 Tax=Daejeonella sp. TaxID=2805397 RepID=UPI0039832403